MLFQATFLVLIIGTTTCLWMAFYLFARGFPSKVTLRGVIALLALSIALFGGANNLFHFSVVSPAWRAAMLIVAMVMWYSITLQLLPLPIRRSLRYVTIGLYTLAVLAIALLIGTPNSFIPQPDNILYVARMQVGIPYAFYATFQFTVAIGILYNLLSHNRVGFTPEGKYFLFASIFPVMAIGYGILALALTPPMPRIVTDILTFSGVFFLGVSVARYQTWVERRTTWQDFPVTTLTVLAIMLLSILLGLRVGLTLSLIPNLAVFIVLIVSTYDLAREFLERNRMRKESTFRKQLRQLENDISAQDALKVRLQEGLDLLCETVHASGGLIAIREREEFIVTATKHSFPLESHLASSLVSCEDISQVKENQIPSLTWIVPSFDGQTQMAVLGIGKPKTKLEYSTGDLDLLAEVADQVGTLISLGNVRPKQTDQLRLLIAESEANTTELNSITDNMLDSITTNVDPEFIKTVEESLRHLSDYIALGQSPLAEKMAVQGKSQIERGKELHKFLIDSIESLRPAEKRPPEPLPRVWYNHAVLYDAYVEGVPNREIMARLYISEGTFNRTRRNALRGLARLLIEKSS